MASCKEITDPAGGLVPHEPVEHHTHAAAAESVGILLRTVGAGCSHPVVVVATDTHILVAEDWTGMASDTGTLDLSQSWTKRLTGIGLALAVGIGLAVGVAVVDAAHPHSHLVAGLLHTISLLASR